MNKSRLQTLKGFRDFLPEDMRIQNYILGTWKSACINFGFQQYDGPPLEYAEIYNKSGDDVGTSGKELYKFKDAGNRDVALRPEMTPSVARIVAKNQSKYPKPLKWFSVAQFFRAENPQRGRGREFFQLNADIFGDSGVNSDFEVINLAVYIMISFGAKKNMFSVRINNRQFANDFFENVLSLKNEDAKTELLRILDKSSKQSKAWLHSSLRKIRDDSKFVNGVEKYLALSLSDLEKFEKVSQGAKELIKLFELIDAAGLKEFCTFDPIIARGFDYYTGMVFEVFDKNPKNNRSMFGGGRYDDLTNMYGVNMPAVGFAPGDITTRLFLESWDIFPDFSQSTSDVFVTVFDQDSFIHSMRVANELRKNNIACDLYLGAGDLNKQLKYANLNRIPFVVIVGPDELEKNVIALKDMNSNSQESLTIDKLIRKVSK